METYIIIDMSRAYLLARMTYEARKVIYDNFITDDKRCKAATLYEQTGRNFNNFFKFLCSVGPYMTKQGKYNLSVKALKTFRDNLDGIWHFAYTPKCNIPNNPAVVYLPEKI